MAKTATQIAYPEWTEYREKNGLDPLGMQTSSITLYQTFLPGISNVTLRVRYYGLYAWLCHTYAERIRNTDPKRWQRFIRRAEALYALVAQKRGGETGMAGVVWAKRRLDGASSAVIDFAADAEPGSDTYYLRQAWGAYGAAYASQLFAVGIFFQSEEHDIPVPGPDLGEPLAIAFGEAAGSRAERFFELIQRGSVRLDDLDHLAPLTPSGIAKDSNERAWYEKILFARAELERPEDHSRRQTLLLILSLAAQLNRLPSVSDVRWTLYRGCDELRNPVAFSAPNLSAHRLKWWTYQANDLAHIAYETLLKYVLDLLEQSPAGRTLESLIGEVVAAIREAAHDWPKSWADLLAKTATDDPFADEVLCSAAMESARSDGICTPEGAWEGLRLLAIVHKRARLHQGQVHQELADLDPSAFRSMLTEISFLEAHGDDDFSAIVTKLIEQRVIRRHLWVALRKLRYQGDYTFLVDSDDGRVRLRSKDGPVFTNPRLGPAITFLKDIYLIDGQGLTEQGRKVLDAA